MTPIGYTPLEFAIRGNCHRIVRVLLESSGHVPRATMRRRASLVWLAVWYGDEETLKILHCTSLDDVDLSYNSKNGWTALEIAKRRRDSNEEWSRDVLQPPDPDPRAWFFTFMGLWADIKDKQKQISNRMSKLSLSTGPRMTNEEVFESDSLDEDQDAELWKKPVGEMSAGPKTHQRHYKSSQSASKCCNVAIGWEGCLANGGPQGPIYGQNRQRTASNRLLESHRKQSSNGLQHKGLAYARFQPLLSGHRQA